MERPTPPANSVKAALTPAPEPALTPAPEAFESSPSAPPPAPPLAPGSAPPLRPERRRYDRSIVEGPLLPAVWKIAWPTMLTNIIGGVQGIVDHVMVGRRRDRHDRSGP